MRLFLLSIIIPTLLCVACGSGTASAISPQNPYRTFNLSGINYGSMQWERAHREGRRAWPAVNAQARGGPMTSVGGSAAGRVVVRSATPQSRRSGRRWRR